MQAVDDMCVVYNYVVYERGERGEEGEKEKAET